MNRIYSWNSTPIINYVFDWTPEESKKFQDELMLMHHGSNKEGSVQFHTSRLGKQDYIWTGEYRFRIWEGQNWRMFAHNKKGSCFEVREGLTKDQVREAWDDYRRKVKLIP